MIVPENKIAIITTNFEKDLEPFSFESLSEIIQPLNKFNKRDWFAKNFYQCLPLTIGNMQGFVISLPFEIDVFWNGGQKAEDLLFNFYEDEKKFVNKSHVKVYSHFGHGIFTVSPPFIMKTPPKVNLMTISPPNFLLPGLTPMCGVVETDNLRYTFTFNIKVNLENVWIKIPANYPIVGILPIPRYFCDNFELVDGYEILDKEDVEKEIVIAKKHSDTRSFLDKKFKQNNKKLDRTYYMGTDIEGNKFSDHQLPKIKRKGL